MDILFFFSVAGIAIVILILKFDKKQTVKVNAILKESRAVPPLFLLKSTEQKISILKVALRYDGAPQNMATAGSMNDIYNAQNENYRQNRVQELKALSAKYNNGLISIETYNTRLDQLLEQVQSTDGSSFELAC